MMAVFDVRFYRRQRRLALEPFLFQGPGQLAVDTDFVVVRGSRHRSFRFPRAGEERVRMVDIVNCAPRARTCCST
jgi:hypothetical protein